jgi:hypothetical protein
MILSNSIPKWHSMFVHILCVLSRERIGSFQINLELYSMNYLLKISRYKMSWKIFEYLEIKSFVMVGDLKIMISSKTILWNSF